MINGQADPSLRVSTQSGHRARGGKVWSGGSFLVGENEPEIFTPGTGGAVTPVSATAGAQSISVGPFHFHGISNDPGGASASRHRGR